MSHIWVSHVTPLNESCHISESVISHIIMSHVAHLNVPCDKWWMWSHVRSVCHTSEWVMLHIRVSRFTPRNESCHTSEWVMSHIWMRHMTDGGRGPTRARCSDSQPRRPFAAVSLCVQGILQHTATHCNTLQHTATHWKRIYPVTVSLCFVRSLSHKRPDEVSIDREVGSFFTKWNGALLQKRDGALLQKRDRALLQQRPNEMRKLSGDVSCV